MPRPALNVTISAPEFTFEHGPVLIVVDGRAFGHRGSSPLRRHVAGTEPSEILALSTWVGFLLTGYRFEVSTLFQNILSKRQLKTIQTDQR